MTVLFATATSTLLALALPVNQKNTDDCYATRNATHFLVGNSLIEVALDRRTGGVVKVYHKPTRTRVLQTQAPEAFNLTWSTWSHHGTPANDLMFRGRFLDTVGLTINSSEVFARSYLWKGMVAIPVWNVTSAPVSFIVTFDPSAMSEPLSPGKVTVTRLSDDSHLAHQRIRGRVSVRMSLAANAIDVVVIDLTE